MIFCRPTCCKVPRYEEMSTVGAFPRFLMLWRKQRRTATHAWADYSHRAYCARLTRLSAKECCWLQNGGKLAAMIVVTEHSQGQVWGAETLHNFPCRDNSGSPQ